MTDVLVIGAGLAGLTAASHLVASGLEVQVLEARDRVGGRTFTRRIHGETIDVGGQWIGPGQERMIALVQELGITTFPTPGTGRHVLDEAGTVSTYSGTVPRLSPLTLLRTQAALSWVEHLVSKVPAGSPWTAEGAEELDSTTVAAWMQAHGLGGRTLSLLQPALRTVFGAEAGELSMLHLLTYASSAGDFRRLIEVKDGFQQDRLIGGAQQISEALADRVGRERLHLSNPVTRIERDRDGCLVHTRSEAFRARRVIVAVPLALTSRIAFDPPLPPAREHLHQRCPMGATVKVFFSYEEAFWREKGLSGEAVSTAGPISVTFDNTAPGGKPQLLAFVTGAPARTWSQRDPDERIALLVDDLVRWFGEEARHPSWVHEIDWSTEAWSGGCPISTFPPGTWTQVGTALREPVGRIHWAGTETAKVCTGFMEGAIASGERVAQEVVSAMAFEA